MTTLNDDPAPRTAQLTEWVDTGQPHTLMTVHEASRALSFLAGFDPVIYVETVFYGRHGRTMTREERERVGCPERLPTIDT